MYSVYLIDDEPWALESLARTLPWSLLGYQITGRFTKAQEAWDALCRENPDVAFIDIRMPDMTGLEIAQRAREEKLRTLFVIVSGHEEFEYAQRAMRLGVFDYCLKPVDEAEGWALLERVSEKLIKDASARYALLCERLLDHEPLDPVFEDFEPIGEYWQVAILRYVSADIDELVYRQVEGLHYLPMRMGARKIMLIFNGAQDLEEQVHARLSNLPDRRIFTGVSSIGFGRDRVARMITEAQSSCFCEFIRYEPRYVRFIARGNKRLTACMKAMENAITSVNTGAYNDMLQTLTEVVQDETIQIWHLMRLWNHLADAFAKTTSSETFRSSLQWILEPDEMPYQMVDFENMIAILRSLMEELSAEQTGAPPDQHINESFLELVSYVESNYYQRGMRLTELAERFHLNLTYCSELFHKVVGMTYTEYLTKLRMEHAMRSIREGNTNLQRLAFDLGYGDYFTFSKRFKQYHGASPSHFSAADG